MIAQTRPSEQAPPKRTRKEKTDALILIDEQRRIIWMNAAAKELTGHHADEIAGSRFCYELFGCENGKGRLIGPDCPGYAGFTNSEQESEREYTITRSDGSKVRVRSDYHFVHQPGDKHSLGMIRMKPLAVKPPQEADAISLRGVLLATFAAMAALFVIVFAITSMTEARSQRWIDLGKLEMIAPNQPTRLAQPMAATFSYPQVAALGTVFVTAERGKPITALAGNCPWDGAALRWHARWSVFVCPEDGSMFERDGTYVPGQASMIGMRRLPAELDGDTVRVKVPIAPPTPMKDQPSYEYGVPFGP